MSTKRVLFVVLVASIVVLAVGVQAQPSAKEVGPSDMTVPYSGRLADKAGRTVADGIYDFSFALYGSEIGGEPLWSEVHESVAVQGGSLHVSLGSMNPIPAVGLGAESWLSVAVRGPGEIEFTALAPRQRLSVTAPVAPSSPKAGTACAHDHWGEHWSGSDLYGLLMVNDLSLGSAIVARTTSGQGFGLYGEATASSGNAIAVSGFSQAGYGVRGKSNASHGVYGETDGDWGWTSGVYGKATQNHANGVTGWNTGGGTGVYGYSESGNAADFRGSVLMRGHGDTSATTSLWVENSGSQIGLAVWDDGAVAIGRLDGASAAHICSRIESADIRNVFATCSSAAEYVPTVDRGRGFPEAGDLVSIVPTASDPYGDAHAPFAVAKASSPYDPDLVGFISDPELGADGWKHNEHYLPLAIYGYFPVKVTMYNGPIRRGDPITSSPKPGFGMKATRPGRIVGYALEDADQEGVIQVIVQVGDHLGDAPARLDKLEAEVLAAKQEREKLLEQNADLEARLVALEALVAGGVGKDSR